MGLLFPWVIGEKFKEGPWGSVVAWRIFKARKFLRKFEREIDAGRPIFLLPDTERDLAGRGLIFLGPCLQVVVSPVKKEDEIRVLLELAGLLQVTHPRCWIRSL